MARLVILTTEEQSHFSSPPVFNRVEQKHYFTFPTGIINVAKTFNKPCNRVYFLLMYGYFRATSKFCQRKFHHQDIDFVAAKLKVAMPTGEAGYSRKTYHYYRGLILRHAGYEKFSASASAALIRQLDPLIRSHSRPKLIFQQACVILTKCKVEVPSYYTLQGVISREMKRHQEALTRTIEQGLTEEQKALLDKLLDKENGSRYRITLLKRFSHSARPAKIKSNIADLTVLRELFEAVEPVVRSLQLTNEGMKYYSFAAIKFQVFQVLERSGTERYLYLLAFITHQYYILQDLFIDVLIQSVTGAENLTIRQQKEAAFVQRKAKSQTIERVVSSFLSSKQLIKKVQGTLYSDELSDAEKLQTLRALFIGTTNEDSELEMKAAQIQEENSSILKGGDYYDMLEAQSLKLQNRVSEVVRQIQFDANTSSKHVMTAIVHFKLRNGNIGDAAPLEFLETEEQDTVFDRRGKLRVSLYKVFLFAHISLLVKAGGLNLRYSYRYRSFDDYLIPKDKWDTDKGTLLQQSELVRFQDFQGAIKQLAADLHKQYRVTNQAIINGTNKHVKFHKTGDYTLITPKEDELEENPITDLFPESRFISVYEVLATVNTATGFLDAFTHWQTTHVSSKPNPKVFYAGIIALGCNIGLKKLERIATHINSSELETTANWYFTHDNLLAANDAILAFISTLSLPKLFRQDQARAHTSSDGQKLLVAGDSLNANYSFKYFGKGKGVTVYSFIDESFRLFFSTVFSSSEREAAYVFDGLLHNEVIKSDIHSTDTHGYAEVIFGMSHLLGLTFAPRIKGLQDQQLYAFEKRKTYEEQGFKLLPQKYINTSLIEEHWDDLLRLAATIKLKETTASQIFKRFNSYSKQHALYQALKVFGQIIKTGFILEYIDDARLRQAIEKQLNKLESSNKFAKAVFHGQNQEFQQETKEEQSIAESCKRLIENAIICWNYLYLSQKLADAPQGQRDEIIAQLKKSSVITWHHINMLGEYDFSDEKLAGSTMFELAKIVGLEVV